MNTAIAQRRISNDLTIADIRDSLLQGVQDFAHAPLYGLFFGGIYALGGYAMLALLEQYQEPWMIVPMALGFPLIGPFVAAGLYEVSRRLAAREPLRWRPILTVILGQSRREMGWMAFVTLFIFWIWIYQVRLMIALSIGLGGFNGMSDLMQAMTSPAGLPFLVLGTAIGTVLSLVLFATTVISMPMLLERNVDFVTAIIASWRTVMENPVPMLGFGLCVAVLALVGTSAFFLGLFLVLPVLGHATWALYKKTIPAR